MPAGSDGPRSINRLIGMFQLIAESADGLTLAQLSAALAAPKSSLLTLLRPLVKQDYLAHERGHYLLGPAAFGWASKILANARSTGIIRDFLARLRDESGETAIFVTIDRNHDRIDYVEVFESKQAIRYSVPAGVSRPLYPSAAGRLMLAYQDPDWLAAYLDRTPLTRITENTTVERAQINAILVEIRASGLSFSVGEAVAGAAGVAAPIFKTGGSLAGCLLIGAPADRAAQNRERLEASIARIAREASEALGCTDYAAVIRQKSLEMPVSASR